MPKPFELVNPDLVKEEGQVFFSALQEVDEPPVFTVREVAMIFFARSRIWLIQLKDQGFAPIPPKNEYGRWYYQLRDVELLIHSLLEHDKIDLRQCEKALLLVKTIASLYHHL